MKNKPSIHYLFLALIFFIHPLILPAQISAEHKQTLCQNNKDAIGRVEKQIKQLEAAQKNIWDRKRIDEARSDYNDVITFIQKLEKFRSSKPANEKATDKEFMIELINPAYDMETAYTNRETLLEISQKDFNDKGTLSGTQPVNTIKALKVIRDSIGRKIDRSVKLKPELDKELKDAKYMLSYHQNRMIELKCDEGSPEKIVTAETEKKDEKEEKNVSKSYEKPAHPSEMVLTETTAKWGTSTATLKWNSQTSMYDGIYSSGGKDQFQLRTYEGETFFMVRLRNYCSYSGTINGNKIQGTLTFGGGTGTFTATTK